MGMNRATHYASEANLFVQELMGAMCWVEYVKPEVLSAEFSVRLTRMLTVAHERGYTERPGSYSSDRMCRHGDGGGSGGGGDYYQQET